MFNPKNNPIHKEINLTDQLIFLYEKGGYSPKNITFDNFKKSLGDIGGDSPIIEKELPFFVGFDNVTDFTQSVLVNIPFELKGVYEQIELEDNPSGITKVISFIGLCNFQLPNGNDIFFPLIYSYLEGAFGNSLSIIFYGGSLSQNIKYSFNVNNILHDIKFKEEDAFNKSLFEGSYDSLGNFTESNYNKPAYINYFDFTSGATTTISNLDEWVKLNTSTTQGFSRNGLVHTNNRVQNQSSKTKVFKLECIASLSSAGGAQELHLAFYKNGDTIIPCSEQSGLTGTGGKTQAIPIQCLVELEENDFIEVWVKNSTSTNNITLDNVNVIITEI